MPDYTPLGEDKLAKKRSRIRVSFVIPIAPASMLSNASRRSHARSSALCHKAATEDRPLWSASVAGVELMLANEGEASAASLLVLFPPESLLTMTEIGRVTLAVVDDGELLKIGRAHV